MGTTHLASLQRDLPLAPLCFLIDISIYRKISHPSEWSKNPLNPFIQRAARCSQTICKVKNPFHPFHPARSAMFFKSLSGWLFLKHAVRFFPDCKSGFFLRGYSHSARMDFHGWKEAQEACLRGRTDNPENVSKEYPRFSICIIFISSIQMAPKV